MLGNQGGAGGAAAGALGGDTYLMTDSVEERLDIPAHTDDPLLRYHRLVTRVQQQKTVTMALWGALLVVNLAFGIWGLLVYNNFTATAHQCERAIRHVLLAAGIAFIAAALFVLLSMIQLAFIFWSFVYAKQPPTAPASAGRGGGDHSGAYAPVPNHSGGGDGKDEHWRDALKALDKPKAGASAGANASASAGAKRASGSGGSAGRGSVSKGKDKPQSPPPSSSHRAAAAAAAERVEVMLDDEAEKTIAATITDNIFMACCSCGYLICVTVTLLVLLVILLTWVYFEHNDCATQSPDLLAYSRPYAIAMIIVLVGDAVWFRFACMTCPYVYDIYTVEQQLMLLADSQNKLKHLRAHPNRAAVASGGALPPDREQQQFNARAARDAARDAAEAAGEQV